MKKFNLSLIKRVINLFLLLVLLASCTQNDDGSSDNDEQRESYVVYNVAGPILNGGFEINMDLAKGNYDAVNSVAGAVTLETNEGSTERAAIRYSAYQSVNYREVIFHIPTEVGEYHVGEMSFGPQLVDAIGDEPVFNINFAFFESDYAHYDNNDDGSDDVISGLIPDYVGITITEYEESQDEEFGVERIIKVKGSFQGSAHVKAFTDPFSEPNKIAHTVEGSFEFYLELN